MKLSSTVKFTFVSEVLPCGKIVAEIEKADGQRGVSLWTEGIES